MVLRAKLDVAYIYLVPGTAELLYYNIWEEGSVRGKKKKKCLKHSAFVEAANETFEYLLSSLSPCF